MDVKFQIPSCLEAIFMMMMVIRDLNQSRGQRKLVEPSQIEVSEAVSCKNPSVSDKQGTNNKQQCVAKENLRCCQASTILDYFHLLIDIETLQ